MDSQTEACIFRLEIFPSFWRMRCLEAPPTTVPHPRRVQRWGQPSCTYHHSFKLTIHIDNRLLESTIDCWNRQSTNCNLVPIFVHNGVPYLPAQWGTGSIIIFVLYFLTWTGDPEDIFTVCSLIPRPSSPTSPFCKRE